VLIVACLLFTWVKEIYRKRQVGKETEKARLGRGEAVAEAEGWTDRAVDFEYQW
jgi:hypothetical protein